MTACSLFQSVKTAMLKSKPPDVKLNSRMTCIGCINMKLVIDGYGKSIHKKDNQIVIPEKDQIIDSIRESEISDMTVIGKGYLTFDALNLMAENNIKLIAINPRGQLTYTLESPDWRNVKFKKEQYKLSENRLGLEISRELIMSKMKNQMQH